jgi:hypothetical protein
LGGVLQGPKIIPRNVEFIKEFIRQIVVSDDKGKPEKHHNNILT